MAFGQLLRSGVLHDVEAFAISLHHTVLDSVVHHLDEVAGAIGSAVQIAEVRGAAFGCAAGSNRNIARARCEGFENRLEMLERRGLRAHHQTVAPLDSPHAAAGARIDVLNAFLAQRDGAAHIILVIRVAAIDQDVARFEQGGKFVDHRFGRIARGHHQPHHARLLKQRDERGEIGRALHAFLREFGNLRGVEIERNHLMPAMNQPARHVAAHLAETYHSDLH